MSNSTYFPPSRKLGGDPAGELARLLNARASGSGWTARCPAHEDRNASLSIARASDGRALLRCFAGCPTEAVCAAVGVGIRDLFPLRPDAFSWRPAPPKAAPADSPDRQAQRARWPVFTVPGAGELRALASLRSLSPEGLALAVSRGVLWSATWQAARCWVVTDSSQRVAQIRRYDGKPLATRGGESKAITLRGSRVHVPVGLPEAAPFPCVLFCEGGGDLLAAWHFIAIEERERDCAAVALLGASLSVHPDALPFFKGKSVTIAAQADAAGLDAAVRWLAQLRPYAVRVAVLSLSGLRRTDGAPVKDLGDLTSVDADDFESNRFLWSLCPSRT